MSVVGLIAVCLLSMGSAAVADEDYENADAATFSRPTVIDNQYLPLRPRRQLMFEGSTEAAGIERRHRLQFSVTDYSVVIDEVETLVVLILDFSEDSPTEIEIAFFAQDDEGNVWLFGEYPESYEQGRLTEVPTWIAGMQGAKAGIAMPAAPTPRGPSYSQGWGPAVDFTDRAEVESTGLELCVPAGCYEDVILIAEGSREEPNAFQLKYYAPGIGNVKVDWRGADANRERLELISWAELYGGPWSRLRGALVRFDRRAREISAPTYGLLPPLRPIDASVLDP